MSNRTPKRPGSPPAVIDTRQTKKPDRDEDNPVSEDPSFTWEFLPENALPPRQEVIRLNDKIHSDVKNLMLLRSIKVYDVATILQNVVKNCDFLEWGLHFRQSLFGDEKAVERILRMVQEAYRHGDYSRLMLIKGLWRSTQAKVEAKLPLGLSISSRAIVEGWNSRFIGTAHVALATNIRKIYDDAINDLRNHKYTTHVSIIQSSGSGKSRLVDKVAETIFTIPFNIREARDADSGAWPPADNEIRDLLVSWTGVRGETSLYARYLYFFTAVFEEIRKEVEQCILQPTSASAWRTHLAENGLEKRHDLYTRVVKSNWIRIADRGVDPSPDLDTIQQTALGALKQLLHAVCDDDTCRPSHTDNADKSSVTSIHVLVYFDEAHVLAKLLGPPDSLLPEGKTALDILFTVLDDFRKRGLFTIFMSTQSHLQSLAPSSSFARSARYAIVAPYLPAPITETPFDCFGDRRIIPSRLRAKDVCDIAFMACFGRPMWRSLLLSFCDEALANASGGTLQDPSSPSGDRDDRCKKLIDLAQSKLVFHAEFLRPRKAFSEAAQTAVLDARIILSFEPGYSGAHTHQMELVASHMRMVYSVSQHREYIRSGYPSEPILAEAAARQLYHWRNLERTTSGGDLVEPGVRILREDLDHDLLDRGEIGEAVGRLLLILSRDRAVLTTAPETGDQPPTFSRAVPVTTFIKELFPPAIARAVLDSKPDNLPCSHPESRTFEEVFEHAVLNFTHFAKWADDSAPNDYAAVGCFVRSMAVICRNNAPKVDVFIPILFEKSARLRPQVMTGILVQFKRRKAKGTMAAYAIDEKDVGLFSPSFADGQMLPRPYITLVMELGIADSSGVGIPVDVGHPPARASDCLHTAQHPRYSITAYGCSREVYQVIGEHDLDVYRHILRTGDPLQEHPHQDANSLDLVRMLKPVFSTGDVSWDWIAKDDPNVVEKDQNGDADVDILEP